MSSSSDNANDTTASGAARNEKKIQDLVAAVQEEAAAATNLPPKVTQEIKNLSIIDEKKRNDDDKTLTTCADTMKSWVCQTHEQNPSLKKKSDDKTSTTCTDAAPPRRRIIKAKRPPKIEEQGSKDNISAASAIPTTTLKKEHDNIKNNNMTTLKEHNMKNNMCQLSIEEQSQLSKAALIAQSKEIENIASITVSRILPKQPITRDNYNKAETAKSNGNSLFTQEKDYVGAIVQYTTAHDYYPGEASYVANRSVCYLNLHDKLNSLHDAVVATKLAPRWSKGYYRLAMSYFSLGRYEDGTNAAMEGITLEPEHIGLNRVFKQCVRNAKMEYDAEVARVKNEKAAKKAAAIAAKAKAALDKKVALGKCVEV